MGVKDILTLLISISVIKMPFPGWGNPNVHYFIFKVIYTLILVSLVTYYFRRFIIVRIILKWGIPKIFKFLARENKSSSKKRDIIAARIRLFRRLIKKHGTFETPKIDLNKLYDFSSKIIIILIQFPFLWAMSYGFDVTSVWVITISLTAFMFFCIGMFLYDIHGKEFNKLLSHEIALKKAE